MSGSVDHDPAVRGKPAVLHSVLHLAFAGPSLGRRQARRAVPATEADLDGAWRPSLAAQPAVRDAAALPGARPAALSSAAPTACVAPDVRSSQGDADLVDRGGGHVKRGT